MRHGPADESILAQAVEVSAELLVMGTVVRTGLPGILIGNTADAVVRDARCSTLMLKPREFVSPVARRG